MSILFASAIMLGAALSFLIQPMIAKALLPNLGGAPAVWNTCLVFFQALLLLGYAYAHGLTRLLSLKKQVIVHSTLIVAVAFWLPIRLHGLDFVPSTAPWWWLLGSLTLSVGLPYFVLAATAPLLMAWYVRTTPEHASKAYILYAASNAGSLLGLMAYPLAMEPLAGLSAQGWIWAGVYSAFAVAMARLLFSAHNATTAPLSPLEAGTAPTRTVQCQWVVLPAITSALLYSVTTYITTDIVSIPLIWAVPLGIYLISWVIAFSHATTMADRIVQNYPAVAIPALLALIENVGNMMLFALHILGLFGAATAIHRLVYLLRPHPAYLTRYTLLTALGGVLGGVIVTFCAPMLLSQPLEYPALLVLAIFVPVLWVCTPSTWKGPKVMDLLQWLVGLALVLAGIVAILKMSGAKDWLKAVSPPAGRVAQNLFMMEITPLITLVWCLVTAGMALIWLITRRHPAMIRHRYMIHGVTSALLICVMTVMIFWRTDPHIRHVERNFFGIHRIAHVPQVNATYFHHGTTMHGVQSNNAQTELTPYSYYGAPVREIVSAVRDSSPVHHIAAVGLGVGSVACYGRAEERFTFFELNPLVEKLSRTYFSFLEKCPPSIDVVIGDGRQMIGRSIDTYQLIILDAFTSDAIPVHLLTKEAFETYLSKLGENGVIAVHISNRHFTLRPVVSRIARELGLSVAARHYNPRREALHTTSHWLAVARKPEHLLGLAMPQSGWQWVNQDTPAPLWTDDYSSLMGVLNW